MDAVGQPQDSASSVASTAARPADVQSASVVASVEEVKKDSGGPTNAALNKKNHRETWPYGNYRSYYSFRPASSSSSATPDSTAPPAVEPRLALLDPSLLANKTLLDLGTNAGKIPLDALRYLGAKRIVGVDIDENLVEDAKALAAEQGYAVDDERVEFLAGDFMREGWFAAFDKERGQHQFDVVSLFSVTKWLHLHNGDEGMRRLFCSLHAFMPPGGAVVVEPQEWENYKKAAKKNKDLRETFKAIEMRPPFEQEMREAGFTLETRVEREEGGFSRPLLVWRK
ncbi:hypothetical protein JCM10213_000280 [Rhodosporidiobolus nylandii]